FELSVVVELGAVVERERLEVAAMAPDGTRGGAGHFVLAAATQFLDDRVASLALHESEHAMAQVTAHHRATFPVTAFASLAPFEPSPADRALAGHYAPR